MGRRFLEHALILTHDPQATRDWFCDNLGFTEGYHPDFGFPVHWLYMGQQDVLHIGKAHNSDLFQLFMREPVNGIKVELNLSKDEAIAAGRSAGWTSTGQR